MVYRFEGVGINDDEWMEVVERQIWAGEARARDRSPGHVGQRGSKGKGSAPMGESAASGDLRLLRILTVMANA
jgi:hypothetical protein